MSEKYQVVFIDVSAADLKCIMQVTTSIVPVAGDMVVLPDGNAFRVVQRSFVTEEMQEKKKVVTLHTEPISGEKQMQITIQCGVIPIKPEAVVEEAK